MSIDTAITAALITSAINLIACVVNVLSAHFTERLKKRIEMQYERLKSLEAARSFLTSLQKDYYKAMIAVANNSGNANEMLALLPDVIGFQDRLQKFLDDNVYLLTADDCKRVECKLSDITKARNVTASVLKSGKQASKEFDELFRKYEQAFDEAAQIVDKEHAGTADNL